MSEPPLNIPPPPITPTRPVETELDLNLLLLEPSTLNPKIYESLIIRLQRAESLNGMLNVCHSSRYC